jgi:hypothetical protein
MNSSDNDEQFWEYKHPLCPQAPNGNTAFRAGHEIQAERV